MRETDGDNVLRKLFGLNLAPIIEQASELLAEAEANRLHQDALDLCRSEIRHINKNIRRLNSADALSAVENAFKTQVRSEEFSDQTEDFDAPIVQTKQTKFLYAPDAVSEQVTAQQAIVLATEPFREYLSMYGDYSWRGIINLAYEIARTWGIDDQIWGAACDRDVLGPERAALCIILIHRNLGLPKSSEQFPKNPAACYYNLVRTKISIRGQKEDEVFPVKASKIRPDIARQKAGEGRIVHRRSGGWQGSG